MALLAWVESEKAFIKIQEGTGDNLTHEDRAAGFVDYVLWSTFSSGPLDFDEAFEPELIDSGIVYSKRPLTARGSLRACLRDAFDQPVKGVKVLVDDD